MIDHVKCKTKIGSDINAELIDLLKYMQADTALSIFPSECSLEHYIDVRESRKKCLQKYTSSYTAGIGYFSSYGGRYFDGGYARGSREDGRNLYAERLKNARLQAPLLKDIEFNVCDYASYLGVKGAVIYCDIPYFNVSGYGKQKFDYERFYDFCRVMAVNNYVFISEFYMPEDFECIWSRERKISLKSMREVSDNAVEKLFVVKERI